MPELRDYQEQGAREGADLLHKYNIAIYVWEVRTGKTATALHAAKYYGAKEILFITKKKAISSINKDANDFKIECTITNYEQLHTFLPEYDLYIIDESHSIGAFPQPTIRAKELKRLCSGKPIILLSGTITPESYCGFFHQLWISSFSPWIEYRNFYHWFKDYGIPAVKYIYNRQIACYKKGKYEKIKTDVAKIILTKTQIESGFNSPVIEEIIYLPMPDKMKTAIKIIKRDKILRLQSGAVVLADTSVSEMIKVHQLCSGTIKHEDGDATVFDYTKAKFIKDKFEGKKIAIFYKYVAEKAQILSVFGSNNITEDPADFNKQADKVFISQVQSGREGINLSTADCLVMLNIDFSAVSYWQARARLQTKDRTEAAFVYWIFMEGGIEEKIYGVVQGKKDFTTSHYKRLAPPIPVTL